MGNSPGLTEIATTTLRNRRAKMPSHSPKQAKTMSAIAHGWKPTGEAADIPVGVAKEFHAADKGKKYGAKPKSKEKGYDRSGHFPGNPGFPSRPATQQKPTNKLYGEYNGGAHAKQPRGKSIGNASEFTGHKANQSYQAELREHHGGEAKGSSMGKHHGGEVAHTGPADRGGSELQDKGPAAGNHHQPAGKSLGAGRTDVAEHHVGHNFGGVAHSFRPPAANMASGYGHSITQRKGPLRMSGHSGAHQVGKRSK
jgi:hypothetical protein